MEANEIMYEEEIEVTEETSKSGNGLKIAGGIAIATIVSALAYKFVAKPVIAKIKAKKAEKALGTSEPIVVDCDAEDED